MLRGIACKLKQEDLKATGSQKLEGSGRKQRGQLGAKKHTCFSKRGRCVSLREARLIAFRTHKLLVFEGLRLGPQFGILDFRGRAGPESAPARSDSPCHADGANSRPSL